MDNKVINLNKATQLDMSTIGTSNTSVLNSGLTFNAGQMQAGSANSGQLTSNAINSLYYPYGYGYPYYQYSTPTYNAKDILVRKVENGWIVVKLGKEYICANEKDLAKLITKEEKK